MHKFRSLRFDVLSRSCRYFFVILLRLYNDCHEEEAEEGGSIGAAHYITTIVSPAIKKLMYTLIALEIFKIHAWNRNSKSV